MYYRYSNNENPMSDWGHAMFVDNSESSDHYGDICYTYDGKNAVKVEDLKTNIVKAWIDTKRGNIITRPSLDYIFTEVKLRDFVNCFNPTDIVDSANAYDSDLVEWLWENVLEPNNIYAVLTQDGAIVFDQDLIKRG